MKFAARQTPSCERFRIFMSSSISSRTLKTSRFSNSFTSGSSMLKAAAVIETAVAENGAPEDTWLLTRVG